MNHLPLAHINCNVANRSSKEDEIAIRAAFLEQENLKLRFELANLKNETAKLRCMIYNS